VADSPRTPERPARRSRRSHYAVEKSLDDSLEVAAQGLAALLDSLQRSGMADGLSGYRTMQAVVIQQKLWALSNKRTKVLPRFRTIARTADALHRIFSGYAAVMDKLRKLDALALSQPQPQPQPGGAPPSDPGSVSGPAKEEAETVGEGSEAPSGADP